MDKVESSADQTPDEGGKKHKVTIGLSRKAVDRLFELKELTEKDSAAQVVRDALRVYDVLVTELAEKNGQLFLRQGPDNEIVKLRLF